MNQKVRILQKRLPATRSEGVLVATTQSAMQGADSVREPPEHIQLEPHERPFWVSIIRARARDEWGMIELSWAAQLARTMALIEKLEREVKTEPLTILTEKGWPAANPKIGLMTHLTGRQVRLASLLRIAGSVVGDSEDLIPKRKSEREAEATLKRLRSENSGGAESEAPLLAI